MSVSSLIAGTHVLLVGVEDHPDGALRLYLDARWKSIYALVYDEDSKQRIRQVWNGARGHITVPMPSPDCIYQDGEG